MYCIIVLFTWPHGECTSPIVHLHSSIPFTRYKVSVNSLFYPATWWICKSCFTQPNGKIVFLAILQVYKSYLLIHNVSVLKYFFPCSHMLSPLAFFYSATWWVSFSLLPSYILTVLVFSTQPLDELVFFTRPYCERTSHFHSDSRHGVTSTKLWLAC